MPSTAPSRRGSRKQRDELAPFHVAPLPWQLAQQLLRNAYDVVFTVMRVARPHVPN
jgi:hypothetical protein